MTTRQDNVMIITIQIFIHNSVCHRPTQLTRQQLQNYRTDSASLRDR